MERRKIIRIDRHYYLFFNRYASLKSNGQAGWEEKGRLYDIKGIDSLLRGRAFEFVVSEEVSLDLQAYREFKEQHRREHYGRLEGVQ